MVVPLFNAPGSRRPLSLDERKQQAFVQLKSICVPLLSSSRLPPSPSTTATLLSSLTVLYDAVSSIPDRVFSPPLANYAFFPLSSLLQPSADGRPRGDAVLEGTMRALGVLIKKWRTCSDGKGMEDKIRTELWIMVALQLGGPLDPAGPGKSKGMAKEAKKTDESKLAMVATLLELMNHPKPAEEEQLEAEDSDDDDPLGEKIDWTADEPSPYPSSSTTSATADQDRPPPSAPPIPILFHTLTTLLSLAASPTSLVRLQLASLEALKVLLRLYLSVHPPAPAATSSSADSTSSAPPSQPQGPSPLLATALPGTASTLSRIVLSLPNSSAVPTSERPRPQPSKVLVAALAALTELLLAAVGDEVTEGLRKEVSGDSSKGVGTLEELVENFSTMPTPAVAEDQEEGALLPTKPPSEPTPLKGPTLPTPSWLAYTLTSISSLLASLSPLSSHDSPLVRTALVDLLRQVLEGTSETMSGKDGKSVLVEGLLVLCGDEWAQVGEPARSALRSALSSSTPASIPGEPSQSTQELVSSIVCSRLLSLPSSIRRQDDSAITRSAKIIRVALDLLSSYSSSALTSAGFSLDKWSYSLLASCDFERIAGAGADVAKGGEGKGMASAWITGGGASLDGSAGEEGWPTLKLRNVGDRNARRELQRLWEAVGRSAGRRASESEVVDFFVGVGVGRRWEGMGASAWWVIDGVLRGLKDEGRQEEERIGKKRKKVLKGVVKSVLGLLETLEEERPEDEPTTAAPKEAAADSDALATTTMDDLSAISVEHQRGVTHTAGLDALKPVASTSTTRTNFASHRILLSCLLLRVLSTASSLLSFSFQPFLRQFLYHLLAFSSPTFHPILRTYAQTALSQIAYSTAYASPQNLILSNVDYIINSVSQRLSPARLDPAAPLVLVRMIQVVGREIVPMVQDLVEDVLEALDDWHGYEEVTVGLWAVLDGLMKVMSDEAQEAAAEGRAIGEDSEKEKKEPDPEKDWKAFTEWIATRHEPAPTEEDALSDEDDAQLKENPRRPFKSSAPPEEEGEGEGQTEFPSTEPEVPPTRPQVVAASILEKALFFLSHSSPFLRSRVLSLISSAVPLLAPLPPSTSTDTSTSPPASTTRPSLLLPIIHRCWPFILLRLADPEPYVILSACDLLSSLSTHCGAFLSRRILDDVWPRFRVLLTKQAELDRESALAGKTRYSNSHRAYLAVLRTMRGVVRDVPLKEEVRWEIVLLFRRFLGERVDEKLASEAEMMYRELGEVGPDAVWLALGGAGEEGMRGVVGFLRERLQEPRVQRVLAGL